MGSRKISTEYDLLHVEKPLKRANRVSLGQWDNKNKILRRKMFWISRRESLARHVTWFNTFPPDLTAVLVISKQLHGNRELCQKPPLQLLLYILGSRQAPGPGSIRGLRLKPDTIKHKSYWRWRICEAGRDRGGYSLTWRLNVRTLTARDGTLVPTLAEFSLKCVKQSCRLGHNNEDLRLDLIQTPLSEKTDLTGEKTFKCQILIRKNLNQMDSFRPDLEKIIMWPMERL